MNSSTTSDVLNLPAHAYHDADVYRREQAAIFHRAWQLICERRAFNCAGDYFATSIGGIAILIMLGDDGGLRAFRNSCTHRGARLVPDGCGAAAALQCPYHAWQFDTRGLLTDTPWFGQPSPLDPARYPLEQIALQEWRGLVFVAVAPDCELATQLGDFPTLVRPIGLESLLPFGTSRLSADVNWKAYFDQFTENYHVPVVHAPDKSVEIWNYTVTTGENTITLAAPGGGMHFGGRWSWLWPNCTLSTFSGGVKLSRVEPTGPASFDIIYRYLFEPGAEPDAAACAQVIASTEAIFRDDLAACRLVQANYAHDNYRPGPLRPDLENGVAYFQARVREAVSGL